MMKKKIADKGVASVEELRDACVEAEVGMTACQMTVDLFDFQKDDLIDDIEYGGAATFLEFAGDAERFVRVELAASATMPTVPGPTDRPPNTIRGFVSGAMMIAFATGRSTPAVARAFWA